MSEQNTKNDKNLEGNLRTKELKKNTVERDVPAEAPCGLEENGLIGKSCNFTSHSGSNTVNSFPQKFFSLQRRQNFPVGGIEKQHRAVMV